MLHSKQVAASLACGTHTNSSAGHHAVTALPGCIELGYADWNQIRTDPDLEFLRQDSRFEVN